MLPKPPSFLYDKQDDFFKQRCPWMSGKFPIAVGLKPIPDHTPALYFDHYRQDFLEHKIQLRKNHLHRVFPRYVDLTDPELELANQKIKQFLPADLLQRSMESCATPPFRDEFDQLCTHLQEDIALWKSDGQREWLAALHLSHANHWAPEEKIGRSFSQVHLPVPQIEPINKISLKLFKQAFERGLQERLAFGLATDTLLDHHPQADFKGRQFDPTSPNLYIRLERQTLIPTESDQLIIFSIRTYFLDVALFSHQEKQALSQSIKSMSPELLRYKGLDKSHLSILEWLSKPS